MRRYASAIVGSGEAEEACQEAWLRIWRAWGSADPNRIEAWAFRIVRNCCLDQRRATKPVVSLAEAALPPAPAPDDLVAAYVDASQSLSLLTKLPMPQREALWLREVGMLSYAEIASVQEVPIGTVMSRLHKARRKAAKILEKVAI
jgi:RNA polymerase sigma-70 factor (ECF subfamily)